MDWFETAMKAVVVLIGAGIGIGLLSAALRVALGRPAGGRLWLERMRQQGATPAMQQEVAELRQMVEQLGGEVGELQERLDFTERVLAQQRERQALPGGADAAAPRSS